MDAPKTLDLLESNPLLAEHFNTAELSVFAQYLHLERIGPATALIQEGDEAQELMVLSRGRFGWSQREKPWPRSVHAASLEKGSSALNANALPM